AASAAVMPAAVRLHPLAAAMPAVVPVPVVAVVLPVPVAVAAAVAASAAAAAADNPITPPDPE
ncbi:MAG: hypothetical protein IKL85_08225, partial [Lentisphaeria bacterium]|nr:hypothetical protein [Lentisphaeria bacterium]